MPKISEYTNDDFPDGGTEIVVANSGVTNAVMLSAALALAPEGTGVNGKIDVSVAAGALTGRDGSICDEPCGGADWRATETHHEQFEHYDCGGGQYFQRRFGGAGDQTRQLFHVLGLAGFDKLGVLACEPNSLPQAVF